MPTITDLKRAHAAYERNEPRDVFYKVATKLIELAQDDDADISRAEALSVLLQSWNARYYVSQHHGRFPREHFKALDRLLKQHADALDSYRARPIEKLGRRG